jgi:hypothetical protein
MSAIAKRSHHPCGMGIEMVLIEFFMQKITNIDDSIEIVAGINRLANISQMKEDRNFGKSSRRGERFKLVGHCGNNFLADFASIKLKLTYKQIALSCLD